MSLLPSLPPETDDLLAKAAGVVALWPPQAPGGPVRRERLTIAMRPSGPPVVEWVHYSQRRIRQGFGFVGPGVAIRRPDDQRPAFFFETSPPPVAADAVPGVLVRDAVLRLWLPREGAPVLARISDAPLPDLGVVGHPDLDGPGGASGTLAYAFTLGTRAAARRLTAGLHPLLPRPENSAHLRLAAAEATALLPEAARAALDWMVQHRDAGSRPAFLVAARAAVLLLTRPGRTPRHLGSAALRR